MTKNQLLIVTAMGGILLLLIGVLGIRNDTQYLRFDSLEATVTAMQSGEKP